jgi:thiaminase/transcriptional activator TenA
MDQLTDSLLADTSQIWDEVIQHRFFQEVIADTLETDRLIRYLGVEYAFIDTAAIVLGHAVTKARSFDERQRLALGLYGLVTDQETFFQNAFESLNVPNSRLRTHQSDKLHALFLGTASQGSYAEILATIFGAEWLYLQWCTTANKTPARRPVIRRWVELHAGGSFASHVYWVRSQLDSFILSSGEKAKIQKIFEETLKAEDAFHDAVYQND